jgi:hypothetical protein
MTLEGTLSRSMAESDLHRRFVAILYKWIVQTYLFGDEGSVFIDDGTPGRRPPDIAGHVPDVYVPPSGTRGMIVGEAETAKSLERGNTLLQIRTFMSACEVYEGSVLVIAVPWDRARLATAILRQCKAHGYGVHVQTHVLEKLIF